MFCWVPFTSTTRPPTHHPAPLHLSQIRNSQQTYSQLLPPLLLLLLHALLHVLPPEGGGVGGVALHGLDVGLVLADHALGHAAAGGGHCQGEVPGLDLSHLCVCCCLVVLVVGDDDKC